MMKSIKARDHGPRLDGRQFRVRISFAVWLSPQALLSTVSCGSRYPWRARLPLGRLKLDGNPVYLYHLVAVQGVRRREGRRDLLIASRSHAAPIVRVRRSLFVDC